MKNFLMILLFLASTTVFAQRITVTGTVTDEGGSPLPGTTVLVKGTTVGVTTDANGKYSVDVSSRTVTLVFSFIGFVTQEVPVENRSVVDVILEAEITGLDEVIVVGYGTQKKSDITGTVASMPKERLEMAPNLSIAQAIQGAVPGVMIQSSNSGANPDQTILVRGRNSITANNDPLIIVDGIPYGGRISDVNPSDIQSIEVLKDASAAAIYGSRGSNGVILITTKEGIIGKVSFSAESKFTIMDVTKTSRPLTGSEFYDFKMTRYAPSMTASEKQIYLAGEGVDWVKLGLRTGQSQEHNLSVSGGFKDTKYYFGGGLLDIKSVAKGDNFRRFSSRINLESKIISWISLGTRTQLTFDDESGANANFENLIEKNPLTKAFDEDGKYTIYPWPENIIVGNPLEPLLYDDLDKSYQILTNNYAIIDFPFIKGLNYRLNTGIRMRYTDRAQYRARNTQSGLEGLGRASLSNSVTNSTIIENILSYNRVFGVHNVFLTALYSYEGYKSHTNSLSARGFANDFLKWHAVGSAEVVTPSTSYGETALISQMLRANYSFDSRYLITLTVRRDGYSGFGSATKWGIFPSAALGWNIANEDFFPYKDLFNELKLRVSYGLNGNQAIGAYETISRLTTANIVSGSTTQVGYKPSKLGMDNLGWESSKTLNIGVDFGILRGRFAGNLNWYRTNTTDLILQRSISPIQGLTSVTQNIGETMNTGFELALNTRNIITGKFEWQTSGNLSFNKNKILSLYGLLDESGKEVDDAANAWFIGHPIRVNFDYVWDGVWQLDEAAEAAKFKSQPGFVKLKDVTGDGALTSVDRQIIGQQDPKLLWGITNTFNYGNISLSIFMHGVQGVTARDWLMNDDVQGAEVRYNTQWKNWWTQDNPTNDWVMNHLLANSMAGQTGRIYRDASFIRIKDVSVSYDLPKAMIMKAGIEKVKFYVTGRNLFTFTKWPGLDPELTGEKAQQQTPFQKLYVFGLSLGF